MVKKIITAIVVLAVLIGGFFICKSVYYNKIYNYRKIVDASMEEYYKSNDSTNLEPIGGLFELYNNNDDIKADIRNYVFDIFNEWYYYLTNKYTCNKDNVNACILYNEEITDLSFRLEKIYRFGNERIINDGKYEMIRKNIKNIISDTKAIVEDPTSKRAMTYEEERLDICSKVKQENCPECKEGKCVCVYEKKSVFCKDIYTPQDQNNRR